MSQTEQNILLSTSTHAAVVRNIMGDIIFMTHLYDRKAYEVGVLEELKRGLKERWPRPDYEISEIAYILQESPDAPVDQDATRENG